MYALGVVALLLLLGSNAVDPLINLRFIFLKISINVIEQYNKLIRKNWKILKQY